MLIKKCKFPLNAFRSIPSKNVLPANVSIVLKESAFDIDLNVQIGCKAFKTLSGLSETCVVAKKNVHHDDVLSVLERVTDVFVISTSFELKQASRSYGSGFIEVVTHNGIPEFFRMIFEVCSLARSGQANDEDYFLHWSSA